jgi:hypothetical protein
MAPVANAAGASGHTTAAPVSRAGTQVRVAVLLFTLPTGPTLNVTPAEVQATYFGATNSVAAYYDQASDGSIAITGDVFGPYAIQGDDRYCSVGDWAAAADSAATAAGADLGNYTNFAYLFSRMSVCPWAGMADIGGTQSFINAPAHGDVGLYHAAHELGHNLGAGHAHGLRCQEGANPVPLSQPLNCSDQQYADPFTVMGAGVVRAPSAWERYQMGLLGDDDVTTIEPSDVGRYRLAVLDDGPAPSRLLLVHRSGGGYLAIEFRQSRGAFDAFTAADPAVNGVMIRVVASDSAIETELIDAAPQTASFADAPLLLGQTLGDPDDGIRLTLVAADAGGATIDIHSSGTPDPVVDQGPPGPPTALAASVAPDGTVQLSWQPPSPSTRIVGYRISRDGGVLGNTAQTLYLDTTPIAASRTYGVQALDNAGNLSPATEVVVLPSDTRSPSAPSALRVEIIDARTVRLVWNAATDDRGVASYWVRLTARRTYATTDLNFVLTRLGRGRHTVIVWAIDGAGHTGPTARLRFRT